jgi:hypothetical protein
MAPRRKLFSFWIDLEHLDALKRLHERDGIQPSEQIRRALRDWFRTKRLAVKPQPQPLPKREAAIRKRSKVPKE